MMTSCETNHVENVRASVSQLDGMPLGEIGLKELLEVILDGGDLKNVLLQETTFLA